MAIGVNDWTVPGGATFTGAHSELDALPSIAKLQLAQSKEFDLTKVFIVRDLL
jgi:hypothetical protein